MKKREIKPLSFIFSSNSQNSLPSFRNKTRKQNKTKKFHTEKHICTKATQYPSPPLTKLDGYGIIRGMEPN